MQLLIIIKFLILIYLIGGLIKTLLLGDSIFKLFSDTLPGDVENKSSVGCFSWMIERDVEKYNIKDYDKVFLLIGINDFLNRGYTSKKTSECVISVINKILSLIPQELNVFTASIK